jgi:hypothetical protein
VEYEPAQDVDVMSSQHCSSSRRVVHRAPCISRAEGLIPQAAQAAGAVPVDDLAELSTSQWERTFRVNMHSYFWTTWAVLMHLPDGGVITRWPG